MSWTTLHFVLQYIIKMKTSKSITHHASFPYLYLDCKTAKKINKMVSCLGKVNNTWKKFLLVKLVWILKFRHHTKRKIWWKWREFYRFRNGSNQLTYCSNVLIGPLFECFNWPIVRIFQFIHCWNVSIDPLLECFNWPIVRMFQLAHCSNVSSKGGRKSEKEYMKMYCQFSRDIMKICVNIYSWWEVHFCGENVVP